MEGASQINLGLDTHLFVKVPRTRRQRRDLFGLLSQAATWYHKPNHLKVEVVSISALLKAQQTLFIWQIIVDVVKKKLTLYQIKEWQSILNIIRS